MTVLFFAAFPVVAISIWLYLKFSPPNTTLQSRAGFELIVLLAVILGCATASYYSYSTVGQSIDRPWWPVIAMFYCLLLFPVVLIIAGVIRRLVYRQDSS